MSERTCRHCGNEIRANMTGSMWLDRSDRANCATDGKYHAPNDPPSSPAEQREHPTPWRVDDGADYCRVLDAKGNVVLPNDITKRVLYRRIVEAVSGRETPQETPWRVVPVHMSESGKEFSATDANGQVRCVGGKASIERIVAAVNGEANLKCELETAWRDNAYLNDQRDTITAENQRLKNESESRMNMARLLATQAGKLEARLKEAETVLTTGMMSDRERLRRIQLILAASAPEGK